MGPIEISTLNSTLVPGASTPQSDEVALDPLLIMSVDTNGFTLWPYYL